MRCSWIYANVWQVSLYNAHALMQPWATTPAVNTLDDQLYVRGLLFSRPF